MSIHNAIGWLFMVAAITVLFLGKGAEQALLWLILAKLSFMHGDILDEQNKT